MSYLMTIDVGNTNISLGLMMGEKVVGSFRLTTKTPRTSDEFGIVIKDLLNATDVSEDEVEDVIISSVVPKLMYSLNSAIIKYMHKTPIIVGPGIKTGISNGLNGAKNVKSKSQVLYHIISTAFNETLKHIIKHYRQDLTFLDYESIFVECNEVSSCCNNLDGVVKILQKNILTDRNALDNINVKVKFDEKFQYGIWTDGCSRFDFSTAKKVTEFVSYAGNRATIRLKERCD